MNSEAQRVADFTRGYRACMSEYSIDPGLDDKDIDAAAAADAKILLPAPLVREPSEREIAEADVVSTVFITCRIEHLKAQNEACGCVGLVTRCDDCHKRAFAIGELQACL